MDKEKKSGLTRRDFIKSTTTAAAATAVSFGSLGPLARLAWADAKSNSIIVGMTQEPGNFNPLLYLSAGTEEVPEACVFDALWDIGHEGKFLPNLAVRIPTRENGGISEDGLSWKIELKKGVKWQDGAPFTSRDVEFTYQTVINPKVAIRSKAGFDLISEFNVIDDHNFAFKLSKPFVPLIWSWQAMHIVPRHILSKVKDINTAEFNSKPMGTGPYFFKKWVPGSHTIYTANPNYHRGGPKTKTVVHKIVPDQTVLYTQMRTGEIDFMGLQGIPRQRYEEAKELKGIDLLLTPQPWVEFLLFNPLKPQFKEKVVRQALYLAADMDRYINDVYYGTVKRTLSYLHPDHWAYNKNLKDPGYDPRKAAQMLDGAGWKVGPDGIRTKNGVKLAFSCATAAGAKTREQGQALLQQNWKEIGVAMEIKNMPGNVVWGEFLRKAHYECMLTGMNPRLGRDPDFSARLHSKNDAVKYGRGGNYTSFSNPEMDRLCDEGVLVSDMTKRKAIYDRIQEIMLDELPLAPVFAYTNIYAKKSGLKGYHINPYTTDCLYNIQDWYWG